MRRQLSLLFALWLVLFGLSGCQTPPPEPKSDPAAERAAALKQEGFVKSDDGWEFSTSEKLLFGANEAALMPSAQEAVGRMARMFIRLDISAVRVDGHTDATGSAAYNDQLSLRRAQAVADALVAAGMPASGISVRGLGSRAPVAGNQTAEERAQNRRVVLVVLGN
ncbi:MAG: OmpA family protein [Azonexus sp.]|jgi:outer membrane protein OmpA-like peptidoglycan-associated protein|uniref:OmpA family protein n=1 Tax=Azonexus sp. TaxID=1872668 RepID=UPI0028252863|nr:OmpA family protein [Azonexus sp.]MDR0777539.1 OmpA family protein [Azonexus sp.]